MRIQKPANRQLGQANSLLLIALGMLISWSLLAVSPLPPSTALAQGNTAVVVGAERLFVRRGPGTEFPPFATLTKGDAVDVQEVQGEWARIVTAGGQAGYVRNTFLMPPGTREGQAAQVAPVAAPTAPPVTPGKPQAAESPALRAAQARNKELEADIRRLQQQVAELKERGTGPPAPAAQTPAASPAGTPPLTPIPAAAAGTDPLRAEVARLTAVIEALQHRLETRGLGDGVPAPAEPIGGTGYVWSSGALALGIIGVAIGWLAGSTLGRKSDRGRRSRIRF